MSIIKNIGNLPPEFTRTERNKNSAKVQRTDNLQANTATQAENKQSKMADKVNLSESGKSLLQRESEIRYYSGEIEKVETLNAEDRQDIESKIDSGFYSSPEVTSFIAGKIATEAVAPQKSLNPARMQGVIENIRSNQYDSKDVLDVVAKKILQDINGI